MVMGGSGGLEGIGVGVLGVLFTIFQFQLEFSDAGTQLFALP